MRSSLDMDGPFALTRAEVDRVVTERFPGTFALGEMTDDSRFAVRYVGRDDFNLRDELLKNISGGGGQPGMLKRLMGGEKRATYFKFSYSRDAVAAYEKHCRAYHTFNKNGRLHNKDHPKPPNGQSGKCPICGES